jgi:hypothetical protein
VGSRPASREQFDDCASFRPFTLAVDELSTREFAVALP